MASLADLIEQYIISLIEQGEGVAEIQRNVLAERFRCAPSQITYVISSRFSPERGFIVESKRGGGGYIRLMKVNLASDRVQEVISAGPYLSYDEALDRLERLLDEGLLDERTFRVMRAAISRNALLLGLPLRDMVRASVFKAMLSAYFSESESEE